MRRAGRWAARAAACRRAAPTAMPSFAGRLSDPQVADLVNYVRSSWGNRGTPNATLEMVAAWRGIARVPEYGTQSASGFDCPRVGGAPARPAPARRRWPIWRR